jgi:hypothetical protein
MPVRCYAGIKFQYNNNIKNYVESKYIDKHTILIHLQIKKFNF